MAEDHPMDRELAQVSDGAVGSKIEAHLRWCADCRSVAAEYRWLEGELGETLQAAARSVPVPRSAWWDVAARLSAGRRRRVMEARLSVVASLFLAVCLMLGVPGFFGPATAAATEPPGLDLVPARAVMASDHLAGEEATPTPAMAGDPRTPVPTPAFQLPPTPPRGESSLWEGTSPAVQSPG